MRIRVIAQSTICCSTTFDASWRLRTCLRGEFSRHIYKFRMRVSGTRAESETDHNAIVYISVLGLGATKVQITTILAKERPLSLDLLE